MLFEELGADRTAGSYDNYHHQRSFGWECFRTKVAAEILPVTPSRLFPFPLGRVLLFAFRRQLSSVFEVRVIFVFRHWWPIVPGCQLLFVFRF